MAFHPNMTLNRDVSATHIPARLARPPRERRRRLPQALIFVGFSETQYKRRISAAKIGYFLRHARVSFAGHTEVVERLLAMRADPSVADKDIRSLPLLDHIPLYSPLCGGVQREGLITWCVSLSPLSLSLSFSPSLPLSLSPPSLPHPPTPYQGTRRWWSGCWRCANRLFPSPLAVPQAVRFRKAPVQINDLKQAI